MKLALKYMNLSTQQHIKTLKTQMNSLRKSFFVKRLAIFGSVAKGKQKKSSDIDILVEFSKPVSYFTFLDLEENLSKLMKRKTDLVTKNALKPRIKKQVLKDAIYVN